MNRLLEEITRIARLAGQEILSVYDSPFAVRRKDDASPVTQADERAEALIVGQLQALEPAWPVVAEEAVSRGEVPPPAPRFWLVDPLDGTREFVGRNGEFTVNIALIEEGRPTHGVVFAPAIDLLFAGRVGDGAWLEEAGIRAAIACRVPGPEGADVLVSRSHGDRAALDAWLAPHGVRAVRPAGSSLKFGLVAAGRADLYPRLSRTMEWDTAAGQAVVEAAGGSVTDLAGEPLRYGKPGYENPHFLVRGRS